MGGSPRNAFASDRYSRSTGIPSPLCLHDRIELAWAGGILQVEHLNSSAAKLHSTLLVRTMSGLAGKFFAPRRCGCQSRYGALENDIEDQQVDHANCFGIDRCRSDGFVDCLQSTATETRFCFRRN